MEFLNGIYKKEVTEWDELLGTSLLNQEVSSGRSRSQHP